MTRRTVIGRQNDGSYGLRCSLPGYDALTGSTDQMSFDSSWVDISQILQIGTASWAANAVEASPGLFLDGYNVTFPNQGYIPFAEIRVLDSNVIYDDWFSAAAQHGQYYRVFANHFQLPSASSSRKLVYIIHKIACPSG